MMRGLPGRESERRQGVVKPSKTTISRGVKGRLRQYVSLRELENWNQWLIT